MTRLAIFADDKEQVMRLFRSSAQYRGEKPNAHYENLRTTRWHSYKRCGQTWQRRVSTAQADRISSPMQIGGKRKIERDTIKQGDCLELMKELPDKSIDMVLCDLPYGVTACTWDKIIPFEGLWREYRRVVKRNGAIVLFAKEPFTSRLIMSNEKGFKHKWVWNKRSAEVFSSQSICRCR